ncbi:MAG: type II/IV secretion system protein [Proteobacteria bacterium]|nr:type II/IV secretion system protein [Pseudomonadota bacterium]
MNPSAASLGRRRRSAVLDHLQARNLADAAALNRADLVSARTGQPVEQVMNQLGSLTDDDLVATYAAVSGCEIWEPQARPAEVQPGDIGVSAEYLRRARMLPLTDAKGILICAACDPLDEEAISGLVFATGRKVRVMAARPADWRRAFDAAFEEDIQDVAPDERRLEREIDQVADLGVEGAGARLVAGAFEAAIAAGASDIHFEPRRHDLRIRMRVDGRLIEHQVVSADLAAPAVSRVKVIANLDLGEKRLPQDGRTTFVIGGRQIDVRVATSPTVFGESAVLRILDRAAVKLELEALGLSESVSGVLRRAAKTPHGIFLVTGPTGSGKTTTLYALLQTFAGSAKKVLSIEDPVEYHFEHVVQTQVAPNLGLTFASALRSFLRQDPDVILVGEIRDPETAAVAVQAAMTGHFVLASVHANDALAVLPRLQDMGVEPYQIAAGFRGAAAQRLVRRLCQSCRRARPATEAETVFARTVGYEGKVPGWRASGCAACKQSGFKGRVAIGEAFLADEGLLRAVADRKPASEVAQAAAHSGLTSMGLDGVIKAASGLTTVEEVMAAVDA